MTQPDVAAHCPWSRRLVGLLALCTGLGCGHSEPFSGDNFDSDQPFDPTPPVQLTLNRGHDRRAAWLPDGSAILYSTQASESRDNDICLAVLPPTGGRQLALTCNLTPNGVNLTEGLESAAPDPGGRLAFVAATGPVGSIVPDRQELSLGTVADPATRTPLLSIPYTIAGRTTHGGVSQIRWLGPNQLLYLGEAVNVITPCQFCQPDTVRSGLEAVRLDVGSGAATPQAVPGTDYASGVSPGSSEDEIYYTLAGDSRVHRLILSTGAASVVHDFGAAGIARDVHVVGTRMAAVVGGRVHFTNDPLLGPTQWDSGGIVHVMNLQDGTDVTIDDPEQLGLFRRPQISPAGSEVVVERHQVILTEIRDQNGSLIAVDTSVARVGDLYLLGQP